MRSGYCYLDFMSSTPAAVSAASAASADSTAAKVAKDAVLNANIAFICAMEASNKAAATEASRGKALSLVKSLRSAKTAAMAAAAVAINTTSKKGFIETAVSLEKQARGMEAMIELPPSGVSRMVFGSSA